MTFIGLILGIIGRWRLNTIVKKYPGWYGIIPFYSDYILFEYAEYKNVYIWAILINILRSVAAFSEHYLIWFILAIIGIIVLYKPVCQLAINFGQDKVMAILIIVLGSLGLFIFGLASSTYSPKRYQEQIDLVNNDQFISDDE